MLTQGGLHLDDQLHDDLLSIMKSTPLEGGDDSLMKLFWAQQLQAVSVKDKRAVRWHPLGA